MKNQDQFVSSVMTALPARESVMSRVGRALCALVLSPVWMWICLLLLTYLYRRPIVAIVSSMASFSMLGFLLTIAASVVTICFFSVQMCRSISQ